MKNVPGVVWTVVALFIPLAVMFVTGLAEEQVITGAIASGVVIVLNAVLKIVEIYMSSSPQMPVGAVGNVAVGPQRGLASRFLFGG